MHKSQSHTIHSNQYKRMFQCFLPGRIVISILNRISWAHVMFLFIFLICLIWSYGCEFFYFIGATSFRLPCLTSPWESLRSKENNASEKASKQKKRFLLARFQTQKVKWLIANQSCWLQIPTKESTNNHLKWGGTIEKALHQMKSVLSKKHYICWNFWKWKGPPSAWPALLWESPAKKTSDEQEREAQHSNSRCHPYVPLQTI